MSWLLPHGASTFVGEIDWIYYTILVITGIAFVLVEATLIVFMVRYRGRPGRKALHQHGSKRAEVIWSSVTAVTVVVVGLMSAGAWNRIKGHDNVPRGALPIGIMAKQFEWNVTYPGADGKLGTADDFTLRNQLHVPVDTPIVVMLESEDAIHSFFVPAFRIKQDAVPGMRIPVWFHPTEIGTFELGCAELCGLGHYRMRAVVTVHAQDDYRRWIAARGRVASLPSTAAAQH
ncbi:MAG: cytochrome c oxidase subunit II [Gemmatimonadaceae bacterium]